ncbi:bifunctional demethylmenaquinone methyltransferase/2-methoxy-6-polyprenyl-1,4-benzoquinol methylase UbiE [Caminibacter mediatlanticus TB-2]|uniref:Demethylmenaquinone methyltransferase n=2 Tax=Caminibacter mediatlanticus TaxID=291048 RepID=A0ABX5VBR9_9BACT|nr:bifunctional demethylmenaquinone methyltransferase/2-methoxy-6-polyprenyl-1,4-benzoquinol methylase UbiE [Caminibacter mediatlanticus TB-2]
MLKFFKNRRVMQEKIVKMFDEIAPTYDLVNRILTFGIDKNWRKKAIREVLKYSTPKKVLDVACGTGDMIEEWRKNIDCEVIGLDPSNGMLDIAKKRFPDVNFINSYANDIPFESEFDAISISFGIRNVVEIKKAIKEFNKALKKNGVLVILEFTKPKKNSSLTKCVNFYTNKFLPKIGGLLSKNKEAYEYLPNSIEKFYTADELKELLEKENFKVLKIISLNFGQVSIIIAKKGE